MELTIKTTVLQDMVGRAIKCSSNNKLIPITSLMNIKVAGNVLYLATTDATNYFYVKSKEKVECEDFEISVMADNFTKLVQKTTSENITLKFDPESKILKVKGNGDYTIELPLDENGNVIHFPAAAKDGDVVGVDSISTEAVKSAIDYNKSAISNSMSYPALTCYYCGDRVVTSNQVKICANDVKTFNSPLLISAQLMELLGVMSGTTIEVTKFDSRLVFETDTECVISNTVEDVEAFPINPITNLIDTEFESVCTVSKTAILNVLDRLSLFMSSYDNKGIDMTVTKDGVTFSTPASSGIELVLFISSENFADYHCRINIEILKEQLSTHSSDDVKLYYGNPKTIKIASNNIVQIIALMEEG